MIDLDRWLTADYVISTPLFPGGGDAPGAGPSTEDDSDDDR